MSITQNPTTATEGAEKVYIFDFTDRAGYLAYRAAWKARYSEAAQETRSLKGQIAAKQKDGGYAGSQQATLVATKIALTDMLDERRASKSEAGRQWRAQKDAVASKLAAE